MATAKPDEHEIDYTWVQSDFEAAHLPPNASADTKEMYKYVTPYCFAAAGLVDTRTGVHAGDFKKGTQYRIDLDLASQVALGRDRFKLAGYEWVTTSKDLKATGTIGDLCKLIFNLPMGRLAYPEYDLSSAANTQKKNVLRMSSLIFDHPKNSAFRGEYLNGLAKPPDLRIFDASKVPLGDHPWVVRMLPPSEQIVPATPKSPGSSGPKTTIRTPADDLKLVQAKTSLMETKTAQLLADLEAAGKANTARAEVLAGLNSLYVLFQCSCRGTPRSLGGDGSLTEIPAQPPGTESVPSSPAVRDKLVGYLPAARRIAVETPIHAVVADASVDAQVPPMLKQRLGLAKSRIDVTENIRDTREALAKLLLDDADFAKSLLKIVKLNIDRATANDVSPGEGYAAALAGTTPEALAIQQLTLVADTALVVIGSVAGTSEESSKVFSIGEKAPAGPAKASSDVAGDCVLEVLLAALGKAPTPPLNVDAPSATVLLPNAADPTISSLAVPLAKAIKAETKLISLAIKSITWAAYSGLPAAAKEASGGGSLATLSALKNRVIDWLKQYAGADADLEAFKTALKNEDAEAARAARNSFAKRVAVGEKSLPVETVGRVFQLVALIASIETARATLANPKVSEATKILNVVGVGTGVVTFTLGSVDTVLTALGKLEKVGAVLKSMGASLGIFGAVLNIASGVSQCCDAVENHDGTAFVQGTIATAGATLELCGILLEGGVAAGPFGVAAVALALVGIGFALATADPDVPGINQAAIGVLNKLKTNEFFCLLLADKAWGKDLVNICFMIDPNGGWVPDPPGKDPSRKYLERWFPVAPAYDQIKASLLAAPFSPDAVSAIMGGQSPIDYGKPAGLNDLITVPTPVAGW